MGDEQWGGWAQRMLTKLTYAKAFNLMTGGRSLEAVTEFELALASAERADRRPNRTSRSGLRTALIKADFLQALWSMPERRAEARKMAAEVRGQLRQFIDHEPFLATPRFWLARVAAHACAQSRDQWDFVEWVSANEEAQSEYRHL